MVRLPVVTKETGQAVCRELEREEDNDFVVRLLHKLEQENPCVAELVSRLAIQHEDPLAISTAALVVYRLLESQAEANALSEQMKLS
jgi:phosphohistidine phosphatase SixA